jgi:hypothetical protein
VVAALLDHAVRGACGPDPDRAPRPLARLTSAAPARLHPRPGRMLDRRDGLPLMARFVILCLCGTLLVGQAAPTKAEETLRGKLAEMVAFIRLAEPCDGVVQIPPEYVTEALSLLIVVDPPISEEMIEVKEEVVKNYREKLRIAKWC